MTALTVDLDPRLALGVAETSQPDSAPRPGVVERMTQILDVFLSTDGHHRLEDVTACTGLPRSTTFRLLSQLVALQWLDHSPLGYCLGGRVVGMTSRSSDHRELRSAAADVLNDLHLRTGATAHLGVLDGASVTYLDKIGGREGCTLPSRVGGQLPAYRTVLGRALLACLPPESVDALLTGEVAARGHRLDLPGLHGQLQQIRQRNGLSVHQTRTRATEITAIAAPVLGPDGAVGAIALARRGALRLQPVTPLVLSAARRTSELLFPGWTPPGERRSSARRGRR